MLHIYIYDISHLRVNSFEFVFCIRSLVLLSCKSHTKCTGVLMLLIRTTERTAVPFSYIISDFIVVNAACYNHEPLDACLLQCSQTQLSHTCRQTVPDYPSWWAVGFSSYFISQQSSTLSLTSKFQHLPQHYVSSNLVDFLFSLSLSLSRSRCLSLSVPLPSVAQQPNSGIDRFDIQASRLHTFRHWLRQPVGLLWRSEWSDRNRGRYQQI